MRNRIIDISQWNTVTDWALVRQSVDAVIIRMGFTYSRNGYLCADNKYVQNRKACREYGIPYTLYYFTNAISEAEAKMEAELVAYECRDISKYILPVFVDSERVDGQGRADGLTKAQRTNCVNAFCSTLQANGVPAGIYCSLDWLRNHLDRNRLPYSLWLAQWGVTQPDIKDYTIWQYTNSATVAGIDGRVDMSTDAPTETTKAERVIALANAEVGYCEKATGDLNFLYTKDKNRGSGNWTKYGFEMHSLQPSNMDYPAAWCMAFCSWLFVELFGVDEAKRMLCGNIDDYTVTAAQRFMDAGRWYSEPQLGDLVFFGDLGISHVGIVSGVTDGYIYTIEGNSGDKVSKHFYSKAEQRIKGYGRPRW